ncbi:hypothetical protein A2707_00350 [Candidatus Saccharibacteria bacterium RIFCSPHIGHO2_01_FULL_45_15]|nr:MAG: hypothetical protein A2707_00350 [Candidatus Saccharibacteria bacterium RIFCSPHIGHO2_01_FULL_45_15]OGL27489.1 MAG: hypothetical protein A3C39_03245 [Candidatus Saccharibacteria bacterium RIFCSPHIGHO2_02_FULL_46_12]OGL32135.1 MAG: hypothetical protein A3E76_04005 [Candidatus Saccharibacteria bacterium RIFCSPHIGHO2_12_FULL_44_22]
MTRIKPFHLTEGAAFVGFLCILAAVGFLLYVFFIAPQSLDNSSTTAPSDQSSPISNDDRSIQDNDDLESVMGDLDQTSLDDDMSEFERDAGSF